VGGHRRCPRIGDDPALLVIVTPFTAMAQTTYEFRMAHSEAIARPSPTPLRPGQASERTSGGRIVAKHFPAGQMGNYTQLIEGAASEPSRPRRRPDTEEAVAPEIAVTDWGSSSRTRPMWTASCRGALARKCRISPGRRRGRIYRLPRGRISPSADQETVNNLAELKGLKLRVPELKVWVNFWKALAPIRRPWPMRAVQCPVHRGH